MKNGDKSAVPMIDGTGSPLIINELANSLHDIQDGLTKREYFAGLAMQAILTKFADEQNVTTTAKEAVENADALLKALGES